MVPDRDPHQTEPERDPATYDPSLNPTFAHVPSEAEGPGSDRFLQAFWEVAKTVAFIVIAALLIRAFVIQPFFVDGVSMEPSVQPSDYLIINQVSYRFHKPQRGDVIVFEAPPEPGENYIKRVIGLPGETVSLNEDDRVVVANEKHPRGEVIEEPYIAPGAHTMQESDARSWTLGPDQYFVLGDNREPGKSSDSRAWGPVPRANIIGKAWLRAYPIASFGTIKHQEFTNLAATPLLDRVVAESLNQVS